MKTTFTKFQILILSTLGLIGMIFILVPIINHSDKYLMPTIALTSWFLLGMYINYLKNRRFAGKDKKIFLLYSRKTINIINIVVSLFLAGAIIFALIYKFSLYGVLIMIGTLFYVLLSWTLFPYRNGILIMIDSTSIYSYETGFLKLNQIINYTLKPDSKLVEFEVKNYERKSIIYNKFLDFESFKKELEIKFENF